MAIETLQPLSATGEDAWIDENSKTSNYGSANYLRLRETTGSRAACLFRFTSTAATGTINSAILTVYAYFSNGGVVTARIARCTRDWVEGQVTWNIWKTGSNWGGGTPEDGSNWDNAVNVTTPPTTGAFHAFEDIKTIVQDAIDNRGGEINLLNLPPAASADAHLWGYRSCEYDAIDPTKVPKLVIDYTASSTAAAPAPTGGASAAPRGFVSTGATIAKIKREYE